MPPMKPLQRLLKEQRGLCFFCQQSLTSTEASVEHLIAIANGGLTEDANLVACCKSVNNRLGSKSLKAKFQFFLSQKGQFQCPNGVQKKVPKPKPKTSPKATKLIPERYDRVVADLKKRSKARPGSVAKLKNAIATLFQKKIAEKEVDAIINQLESRGAISTDGSKITYRLKRALHQKISLEV